MSLEALERLAAFGRKRPAEESAPETQAESSDTLGLGDSFGVNATKLQFFANLGRKKDVVKRGDDEARGAVTADAVAVFWGSRVVPSYR